MALQPVALNLPPNVNYERLVAAITAINQAIADIQALDSNKQDKFNLAGLLQDVSQVVARAANTAQAVLELDREQQELTQRLTGIGASVTSAVTSVGALLASETDYLSPSGRPGENPSAYTLLALGDSVPAAWQSSREVSADAVKVGDSGAEVVVVGPGTLTTRAPFTVEPGRAYRARYVVQRRANATDPSNDSVQLGVFWSGATGNPLPGQSGTQVVEDVRDLLVLSGRQERISLFSLTSSSETQFTPPPGAHYGRLYVRNYGLDGVTAVQVLDAQDVTNGTILAPETVSTVQRVNELESQNAGQRLSVLESNANAPNSVTFATKTDAASGTIPSSVTTVAVRGSVQPGDGGDGIYKKISGTGPTGGDTFTNQGITYLRVYQSSAVLGALLNSLPTTLPPVAGRAWLNGGVLAVS